VAAARQQLVDPRALRGVTDQQRCARRVPLLCELERSRLPLPRALVLRDRRRVRHGGTSVIGCPKTPYMDLIVPDPTQLVKTQFVASCTIWTYLVYWRRRQWAKPRSIEGTGVYGEE